MELRNDRHDLNKKFQNASSDEAKNLKKLVAKDITLRKEGEKAIRESGSRFKGIFEGAGIGIAMIDPYGKLIESNQAVEDFFGIFQRRTFRKAHHFAGSCR